ncbi:MAG: hypothetical protein O9254_01340 [Rhodobacteraceae bacterium]|nr:hypothetical protein [Paracoccaceae bacterium]
MNGLIFAISLTAVTLISVWASLVALRRISGNPSVADRIGYLRLFVLCLGLAVVTSVVDGAWIPADIGDYGLPLLVVWATITALIDRATAWVTDLSAVLLLFGAMLHDPSASIISVFASQSFAGVHFSGSYIVLIAVFASLALWASCLGVFWVQRFMGRIVLTAADCLAVALPSIAFGLSYETSASYALTAFMILIATRFDFLHSIIADSKALREGLDDLGQDQIPATRALPAFIVFAPVTAVVAVAQSTWTH